MSYCSDPLHYTPFFFRFKFLSSLSVLCPLPLNRVSPCGEPHVVTTSKLNPRRLTPRSGPSTSRLQETLYSGPLQAHLRTLQKRSASQNCSASHLPSDSMETSHQPHSRGCSHFRCNHSGSSVAYKPRQARPDSHRRCNLAGDLARTERSISFCEHSDMVIVWPHLVPRLEHHIAGLSCEDSKVKATGLCRGDARRECDIRGVADQAE